MILDKKSEDMIIDLESEDLTYTQARNIRLKIEKDVLQLQNRVRMLQEEEARAKRKIQETRKKTQEISERMVKNDHEYRLRMLNSERSKIDEEHSKQSILETKNKQSTDIKIRATEL